MVPRFPLPRFTRPRLGRQDNTCILNQCSHEIPDEAALVSTVGHAVTVSTAFTIADQLNGTRAGGGWPSA